MKPKLDLRLMCFAGKQMLPGLKYTQLGTI